MKRIFRSAIMVSLIAGTFGFAACGDEKKEVKEDASLPMQNEMHMEEVEADAEEPEQQSLEFKDPLIASAYQHYEHLKTALVNSNAEEAKNGAKMLTESLQKIEGSAGALTPAKEIAETDDLNVQRTAFANLSEPMEKIITGSLASGEVYKQFCPMAFEGKGGYWLSSSQEIRNPYYGDKMLKCGSVKATIQ